MPAGITDPVSGYLAFFGVKAIGYVMAAPLISLVFNRTDVNPVGVGVVRTLIGMAAGAVLFQAARLFPSFEVNPHCGSFMVALVTMRMVEWWLVIWLFYNRRSSSAGRDWAVVLVGVAWSFFLDVPAILGYISASGFWIC